MSELPRYMFQDVCFMNEQFGNPKGDKSSINWPKLNNQCGNILDEYEELQEALLREDPTHVRDALCDIMVFTLGAYHFLGYDANKDMQAVFESNMSKLCTTSEEIVKTVDYYTRNGVKVYTEGELPFVCVKSLCAQTGKDGKNFPKDKFLKNINWREPQFEY
jgi:NTP pyrophosphatase (non-canonical NTP hydrolase)